MNELSSVSWLLLGVLWVAIMSQEDWFTLRKVLSNVRNKIMSYIGDKK